MGEPLRGHDSWVRAVAAATVEGRAVAVSGGLDGTVRVWDLARGAPAITLPALDAAHSLALFDGGVVVAAGSHVLCVNVARLRPSPRSGG